jgi:hypothetical protein
MLGSGVSFGKYPVLVAAADSKSVYLAGVGGGKAKASCKNNCSQFGRLTI